MKKKTRIIISIILAAAIVLGAVIAVITLTAQKTVKVGVLIGKPMAYKTESGEWEGYDVDFANKIFGDLGYEVEFVEVECTSREKMLEKGEIDCYMSGTDLTENDKFIFSKEYVESTQVLFYKKGYGIEIAQNSDLKSYRVGVLDDSENMQSVAEYVDLSRILEHSTVPEMLEMLKNDRINVGIIDYMTADSLVKNDEKYKNFTVGIIYDTNPHAIVLPAKKGKLQNLINEKIAEYEQAEYFDMLKKAHFMENYYY